MKKMITIKRYIPSREDYTEPLNFKKLKEKGITEKYVKKLLGGQRNGTGIKNKNTAL